MDLSFIDCQALSGGGVTLGAVLEGFTVSHRVALPGGFGNAAVKANAHLLGEFDMETGPEESWTPVRAAYLNGTPPCSGFSGLNTAMGMRGRGMDSEINHCQRALVRYASRCTGTDGRRGPQIVAFESVRAAYSSGHPLMSSYLRMLRENTGENYQLYHLLHSDASLNGPQIRPRYFWFAARIPVRIFVPDQLTVPSHEEVYGDLMGLPYGAQEQPYPRDSASPFARVLRRDDGKVTWHVWKTTGVQTEMFRILMQYGWIPGEPIQAVYARHAKANDGAPPPGCERWWLHDEQRVNMFGGKFRRDRREQRGHAVLVGGCDQFVHYEEQRLLSIRELARLMSLPDAWSFDWTDSISQVAPTIGKNCPVTAGRWAASIARFALTETEPSCGEEWEPHPLCENEFLINITRRYTKALAQAA